MRGVLFRIAAMVAGVAGALLLGEIAVRMWVPPPERARLTVSSGYAERLDAENAAPARLRMEGSVEGPGSGPVLYFYTPTGMRLRANTHAVIEHHRLGGGTVEVRTNSLGYRNRELGPKRRPRVLFLGDSITVQDYLPEEETIVRLVETLSERTRAPLETVNAGVGAIGSGTELAILLETGFSVHPDVVVLDWYLNDAQPSAGVEATVPTGWLRHSRLAELLLASVATWAPGGRRRDLSVFSAEIDAQWRAQVAADFPPGPGHYLSSPAAFNQRIQDLFFDWGSAWSDGAWERMAPIIAEMKRQADLHGARFLIVAFPVAEQVRARFLHDHPQRRLREVAGKLGVPVLDLLPVLRARVRESSERVFWDWCHPSPEGSEIIAAAILEFLQRAI